MRVRVHKWESILWRVSEMTCEMRIRMKVKCVRTVSIRTFLIISLCDNAAKSFSFSDSAPFVFPLSELSDVPLLRASFPGIGWFEVVARDSEAFILFKASRRI